MYVPFVLANVENYTYVAEAYRSLEALHERGTIGTANIHPTCCRHSHDDENM
jgi:hypothetical protein